MARYYIPETAHRMRPFLHQKLVVWPRYEDSHNDALEGLHPQERLLRRHLHDLSRFISTLLVSSVQLITAGCASSPPFTVKQMPSAIVAQRTETLDPKLVKQATENAEENKPYLVGPGDSVLVAVYGHPELSIAPYVGGGAMMGGQMSRLAGLIVDNDGTIQF